MRPDTAEQIRRLAGQDLEGAIEGPFELGRQLLPARSRGVYVIEDTRGRCVYVGKVCSQRDGERLAARVGEHRGSSPAKMTQFDCVYFVPVLDTTPERRIQELEGQIARHMRPILGSRWPT